MLRRAAAAQPQIAARLGAVCLTLALLATATTAGDPDESIADLIARIQPPAGIKGPDDRLIADSSLHPWSAFARLNLRGKGFCTAVLVAPGVALTARHCVIDQVTGQAMPVTEIHFVAGYMYSAWLAHSQIAAVGTAPAAAAGVEDDFAVLTLETDVSEVTGIVPPVAAEALGTAQSFAVLQAGYSRDRDGVLTLDPDCEARFADSSRLLLVHDCDATHGDSGSALLVATADGFAVLAIHVATLDDGEDVWGLAIPAWRFFER